jgi:ribosomal protein S18 acetylase RimI-like enzyme
MGAVGRRNISFDRKVHARSNPYYQRLGASSRNWNGTDVPANAGFRRMVSFYCSKCGLTPASDILKITPAAPTDLDEAVGCLAATFAQDPITGFLLQTGPGYRERVTQFLSLLMRARLTLKAPVLVARGTATGIHGAAMGYTTVSPAWPTDLTDEWDRFEKTIPGMTDRMAVYDEIAARGKPPAPHYYLGVIGVDPQLRGQGIGAQLLQSFCDLSASDRLSGGVYLETANPSNVRFYERAGFVETGRGSMGTATLWCMYLPHTRP